jgi:hypothetical protein
VNLHILAAAVVTATSLHAVMEPKNIMIKLHRYAGAVKNGKISDLPMKGIDTRAKSYALGVGSIVIMTALSYLIINAINPSVEKALQYIIIAAIIAELLVIVQVDKYHSAIEKYTQKAKKK